MRLSARILILFQRLMGQGGMYSKYAELSDAPIVKRHPVFQPTCCMDAGP